MTYLGVAPGGHGHRFMCSPNNVVYTSLMAVFDETMFPRCPDTKLQTVPKKLDQVGHQPTSQEDSDDDDDDDDDSYHHPHYLPKGDREDLEKDPEQPEVPHPDTPLPEQPPMPKKPSSQTSRNPQQQEQVPRPSSAPDPSANNPPAGSPSEKDEELQMAQLCQEGGVGLINLLLVSTEPLIDQGSPLSNVREWTFHDILALLKGEQEKWKTACNKELEAL
ncbi:hypothetical protein DAEQUDRAFT_679956 [Daedalea quercina L-15889]|uniref:Uncharacterized protein n=1 Tax=Daedalea quercina L-15889 TaxID=1314783 RepID=A0A165KWE7_9APHY|nr:hypothetical protein DAEQUDRAFT_679956 [Daedalea quercina L-15889]